MRYKFILSSGLAALCFGALFSMAGGVGNLAGGAPVDIGDYYNSPIEANADELNYDKEKGRIIAKGHVVISCAGDQLTADKVLVNINSGDAYAMGHVVIKRQGMKDVKGTKIQYNFRTRKSSIDDPDISVDPFHVVAEKVTRNGKNEYVLYNARVTTCNRPYPHCHYSLKAKRINVVPKDYMKTRGAVLSLGRIPIMYLPYWRHNLKGDSGFIFLPGYRNKMGAFLLSSYYHRINPYLKAEHHIDYRSRRGFGFGEDWDWNTSTGNGKLRLYYLNDDEPMDDVDKANGLDIDSQRYRIHLQHNQSFGDHTSMMLKGSYLSDPKVIDDFFNHEYRYERQPENYVTLSHRRNLFTFTALANTRLNDFYSNVNRMPELSLNFNRTQIGNSSFYYESYTAGSMLEKVWEDDSSNEDYSSVRLDTRHMIYQPRRYMGWLNLVPRAGYRGTYYSATMLSSTSTNVTIIADTNTVSGSRSETNVVTHLSDGSAKLRNIFEVGAEVSFKAFRTMKGGTMRHIVEPYANYTYSLDPNIESTELYQFDDVDTLDEVNNIMIGVRNKIQNKRNGYPNDLADINTWTTVNFSTKEDEKAFDKLYLDSDFYPATWLYLNLYGHYSVANSELEEFNTRLNISRSDMWNAQIEHRYRNEESNLLNGRLKLYPNQSWAFAVFGRYEFEESRVEEEGAYIEHKLDCIGMRLGGSILPGYTRTDGTEEDDDYRIMVSVWLTAFPKMGLNSGR